MIVAPLWAHHQHRLLSRRLPAGARVCTLLEPKSRRRKAIDDEFGLTAWGKCGVSRELSCVWMVSHRTEQGFSAKDKEWVEYALRSHRAGNR